MKKNKLNMIFGNSDSFKTIFILNKIKTLIKEEDKKVAFITIDNENDMIEKTFHCIYNEMAVDTVKLNHKTFKPVGLKIPDNFYSIDWVKKFESLENNINKMFESDTKPDYIFIDNLNLIDIKNDNYNHKLELIFNKLNELAEKNKVTIVGTFNVLKISDYDIDDYSDYDSIAEKFFLKRKSSSLKVYWKTNVQKFKLDKNNLTLTY